MADLVKELLAYISETPRRQRMKDWDELSSYGEFGPNAFEYLDSVYEKIPEMQISNRCLNPEFSLDFFVFNITKSLYHGTGKIFTS